jgi:uncharacterized protein (TIGR02246 family)
MFGERRTMTAATPEAVIDQFTDALHRADLDALLQLYEEDAAFAPQPGTMVVGIEAIREALKPFLALRPKMTGEIEKVIAAGDTALVCNRWSLSGTGPDGAPITMSGTSADVMRKQPDGRWLVAIDDPWGAGTPAGG